MEKVVVGNSVHDACVVDRRPTVAAAGHAFSARFLRAVMPLRLWVSYCLAILYSTQNVSNSPRKPFCHVLKREGSRTVADVYQSNEVKTRSGADRKMKSQVRSADAILIL